MVQVCQVVEERAAPDFVVRCRPWEFVEKAVEDAISHSSSRPCSRSTGDILMLL
jgi:hypothetical protein